jgi:hypothetical protein
MSLLPNTETIHNQQLSSLRAQRQHKAQWHLTTLAGKGNRDFILEFSGLCHYHLKEGRKPKYSEKTPDDLFIRRLIPVWKLPVATVVRTTALPAAHSLPAAETGGLNHCATGRPCCLCFKLASRALLVSPGIVTHSSLVSVIWSGSHRRTYLRA